MLAVINELVNPIFDYVRDFKAYKSEINISDFKPKIISLIENFSTKAISNNVEENIVQDIKYGLTAFIDEMVLISDWQAKYDWCEETLQIRFFGDHLAGERFFEKLSNARIKGESYLAVITIYYACLELGFCGIYRIRNKEYLITLKRELKEQIEKFVSFNILTKLHLNKENSLTSKKRESNFFDPVIWAIGIGVICFATFVGYKQAIDKYEGQILAEVTGVR